MKYFYDTEFHENGSTIDFISIGIVAENGDEYYGVSNEFDTRAVAKHNWLMDNVMSSIPHEQFVVQDFRGARVVRDLYITDPAAKSRKQIAQDIACFVGGDREAEFWAWYGAYDHVCLAQLWGKMIDLPNMMPMHTDDLKTLVRLAEKKTGGKVFLPKQPDGHHNALADAKQNLVRYNYLMEILNG